MNGANDFYHIGEERDRRLILLTMTGFWNSRVVDGFQTALRNAIESFSDAGPLRILADTRNFAVQSQDSIGRFSNLLPDIVDRVDRVAFIAPAALVRMQVARIDGINFRRTFASREDALRWLLEDASGDLPPAGAGIAPKTAPLDP